MQEENSKPDFEKKEISFKEKRIRNLTVLYYSQPLIQEAIFKFSENREISPRYFEGFGKRPDTFQYKGDILGLVKKGATSFHCSEELWQDPLKIETGMTEQQANEIRIGWDLVIDIDCKWFDYAKMAARAIIEVFKDYKITNIGIKFSGSKGFHLIVPWKSFPKTLAGEPTKNLFPDLPRKIVGFIRAKSESKIQELLPENFYEQFKNVKIKKGIKCESCGEIAREIQEITYLCPSCRRREMRKISPGDKIKFQCPECKIDFQVFDSQPVYQCEKCSIDSKINPRNFSRTVQVDLFELMGLDLVLVSPRHLFRMPYSLHEKTSLSSIVIDESQLDDFQLKDADAMKIQETKNFLPDSEEGEASELVREALDWAKENELQQGESVEKIQGKYSDFKPLDLKNIQDSQFPPCTKLILRGLADGRKRATFALINIFRSVGLEKEALEKKLFEWNQKNKPPLKQGYLIAQLNWAYQRKPLMPPNCKEFYQGIGVCAPDMTCSRVKNPVNYVVKKNYFENNKDKPRPKGKKDYSSKKKTSNNFKNNK